MKGVIWNWGDPTYHQKVKKTRIRITRNITKDKDLKDYEIPDKG